MQTYIVDSFTDKPFTGNPAGVCLLDQQLSNDLMLLIAQELGLSETAFVRRRESSDDWSIRFFSPVMEIPLCGHATLAAARVLFDKKGLSTVSFVNVDNLNLLASDVDGQVLMEFPSYRTHPCDVPPALVAALKVNAVVNAAYNKETNILLLEIESVEELAALEPDFTALFESHDSINGVVVTAASNADDYDFHSRYFWPWTGTNEDPVTGGTHTFLGPYWGARLNKKKLWSFQSSKRTGRMLVELQEDTIRISGQAVIVLRGYLELAETNACSDR